MIAEGLGNKEIASKLRISDHTVKFHISSIFAKLGASSRTEAVTIGIRGGMIMVQVIRLPYMCVEPGYGRAFFGKAHMLTF